MPTLNRSLQRALKWKGSFLSDLEETALHAIRPVEVQKLYPLKEKIDPVTGELIFTQGALPHQALFHERLTQSNRPKAVLLNGGVGSGKTTNACVDLLACLKLLPGYIAVVVAAYDYYFDEFFLPIMSLVIDEKDPFIVSYNKSSREWIFANGSKMRCKAYDDPSKIKGWNCHRIHIIEGSELGGGNKFLAKGIWDALWMRLRAPSDVITGLNYPLEVTVEQNPGKGHNWIWQIFIKDNPTGDAGTPYTLPPSDAYKDGFKCKQFWKTDLQGNTYWTISSGSDANPHNPPGYVSGMLAQMSNDPGKIQRMVDGDFAPINQLIYELPYYSMNTHLIDENQFMEYWGMRYNENLIDASEFMGECDNFSSQYAAYRFLRFCSAIPQHWEVVAGVDPAGQSSPYTVQFYLVTDEDDNGMRHIVAFAEIYAKGLTTRQIINQRVKPMIKHMPIKLRFAGDPHYSMQRLGPDAMSIKDAWRDESLDLEMPRGYNKEAGIKRIQEMMLRDRRYSSAYFHDSLDEDHGSVTFQKWDVGRQMLYYLGYRSGDRLQPYNQFNLMEKDVWRRDRKKERTAGESEEGLSKTDEARPVDSDDHAQTAEIFAFLLHNPFEGSSYRLPAEERQPFNYGRKRRAK